PRKRRDKQSPRKHNHQARPEWRRRAAPPKHPRKPPSTQSHALFPAPHSIPRKATDPASATQSGAPPPDPAPWPLSDKPKRTSRSSPRKPSCPHTVLDAAAAPHTSSSEPLRAACALA